MVFFFVGEIMLLLHFNLGTFCSLDFYFVESVYHHVGQLFE